MYHEQGLRFALMLQNTAVILEQDIIISDGKGAVRRFSLMAVADLKLPCTAPTAQLRLQLTQLS